jgi:hypothetical protein
MSLETFNPSMGGGAEKDSLPGGGVPDGIQPKPLHDRSDGLWAVNSVGRGESCPSLRHLTACHLSSGQGRECGCAPVDLS